MYERHTKHARDKIKQLNLKKMEKIQLFFDKGRVFETKNFRDLTGVTGLYFIYNKNMAINYPFGRSRLIYIGMSEKKTNSIGKRLNGHFDGSSGNLGISSYRKVDEVFFTYVNFEMLSNSWSLGIEPLESYFITSFVKEYGVYPICNNKSGYDFSFNRAPIELEIKWSFFEK